VDGEMWIWNDCYLYDESALLECYDEEDTSYQLFETETYDYPYNCEEDWDYCSYGDPE